jgi:hypothetical protein
MFHDLLAFLKERVLLSTTFMAIFNVLSVHMLLQVVEGIWFSCGDDLFLYVSRARKRFSFFNAGFVACKSSMLVCLLRGTMQSTIIFLVLGLASNNLVECVLAPPKVLPFFSL